MEKESPRFYFSVAKKKKKRRKLYFGIGECLLGEVALRLGVERLSVAGDGRLTGLNPVAGAELGLELPEAGQT